MLKLISKYFTNWWVPIISYFFIFSVFILGCLLRRDWIIDIFLYLYFINVFGVFIWCIVQLFIKKWHHIILPIIITFLISSWLSVVFMFSPPDFYGVHKTIPNNIEIYKPIKRNPEEKDFLNNHLVLSSQSQPGIYNYHTDFTPKNLGYFYIKVFEVTSNDKLSTERIKERSKIKINDLEPKIHIGRFTIYEGSWGHKYGSRIELWFKPYYNQEYKITERNYIVEGWMR